MSNKPPQYTLGKNPDHVIMQEFKLVTKSKTEVVAAINKKRMEEGVFINIANEIQSMIDEQFPIQGFAEFPVPNQKTSEATGELTERLRVHFGNLGYDVTVSQAPCVITKENLLSDDDDIEDNDGLILHVS